MEREVKLIQWLLLVLCHLEISAAFFVYNVNEVPSQAVKACGKMEVKCHAFLTLALDGSGQLQVFATLAQGNSFPCQLNR
jgi:hypothetical protein